MWKEIGLFVAFGSLLSYIVVSLTSPYWDVINQERGVKLVDVKPIYWVLSAVPIIHKLSDLSHLRWAEAYSYIIPTQTRWNPRWLPLYDLLWWGGWICFVELIIPAMMVVFWFGAPLSSYGIQMGEVLEYSWLFLGMVVLWASVSIALLKNDREMRAYYPFYDNAGRSLFDLFLWELIYFAQFVAAEFFYRGFLLHGCAKEIGSISIFIANVPYAFIHSSMVLGVVLGIDCC
eukprot:TRINITY_DN7698_c0_g1_i2.p1 TRINITY_DN7698_c0_g1~~TRINITY_DN7698_c0_g1_i2.p1  ORF type:complete len:232 (+),score=29.79 TRINITY_DN7698_c0_g1_i2:40-735(+)